MKAMPYNNAVLSKNVREDEKVHGVKVLYVPRAIDINCGVTNIIVTLRNKMKSRLYFGEFFLLDFPLFNSESVLHWVPCNTVYNGV